MPTAPVELSGIILIREGELLLLHREDERHWEMPGGKVEEEESPTQAAVREASEEISVEVELEKPFYTGEFQKDGKLYIWHAYLASADEEPEMTEDVFDDMKWFTAEELDEAELAPNIEMIEPALKKVLK
ncbi:NUDIX domain-containing protein [Nanohaloarchaea archaeon]|nr:NUDIX domain-containing protein [Candidatus Nanohaloarchaea archaeon]